MDITLLRIATTVVGFVCFLGIVLWVYDRQKTKRFDEAAQLPFLDE
jgi:cytochrome c oxidase cbb3-type subunit 4